MSDAGKSLHSKNQDTKYYKVDFRFQIMPKSTAWTDTKAPHTLSK